VVAVFRRNGFPVHATTKFADCQLGGTAYVITNAAYEIDPGTYAEIQDTEGTINCSLARMSIYVGKPQIDLHAPEHSPLYHGRKAEFSFENLDCVLHAGDVKANEQVTRFARAVRQLVRRPD
jgi:hypothetical protein